MSKVKIVIQWWTESLERLDMIRYVIQCFRSIYSIMVTTVWNGKQGKEGTDAYYIGC
ncbi:hypothetical protein Back11_62180 [Paenibacillus baekrokdamisoli]|uniref:Uncharacterized protein n=1 Tax=Paenibacillus baekrokdamisoli TaxID=1712516 RepID=A0A3G9JIR7_9BACL|nr:hypothetical protein Back11_62180 [Paenibacillus baekrokdamisoli]